MGTGLHWHWASRCKPPFLWQPWQSPVPPGTELDSTAGAELSTLLCCCCLMPFLPSGLTALLHFNSPLLQLIRTWGEVRATSRGWTNPITPMSSAGPRGQGG